MIIVYHVAGPFSCVQIPAVCSVSTTEAALPRHASPRRKA